MFYSFERLHNMSRGNNLEETIREFPTCSSRIQYVKDFLSEDYGYDCSKYLSQILSLDALTLNCDRHFNNLGAIINYAGLEERLSMEPDRRPVTVLKLQMEKMRGIIPEIDTQELEEHSDFNGH